MPRIIVRNGTLVPGDGRSVIASGALVVEDGRIREILQGEAARGSFEGADRVIDATDRVVMPGVINNHAHGIAFGPIFPSGHEPLPREQVLKNLDRHLLEGSTTLLSLDGFITPQEVEETRRHHPMNIYAATCNTPKCREAAEIADGTGLTDYHRQFDADRALDAGAVALGEIGAGHTLGGGGQDYMYIPAAVREVTGREITPHQAQTIKFAVLGRYVDPAQFDRERVQQALHEVGLADVLTPERARQLIEQTVLPPFNVALDGLRDAGAVARRRKTPLIAHNSAPSKRVVLELAEQDTPLIAGHSNHTTFTVEEAVEQAQQLRRLGATVDVSTLDGFGARRLVPTPEHMYAMLRENVVDTVSTDYAAGFHDGILLGLEHALREGVVELPRAVALATANVARAIPGLAPDRGRLEPGLFADVVITAREALSRVDTVLIGGEVVVEQGRRAVAA